MKCLTPILFVIYKRKMPGMLFILWASFFHTCNMGMKITHIDAVFLEAWMYSCAHTGMQEAFNK